MLRLFTVQIYAVPGFASAVKQQPPQVTWFDQANRACFVDTTSRGKHPLWAPGYDIVMAHKDGRINDAQYTETYRERMRDSYRTHKDDWDEVLRWADQNGVTLVLGCYCYKGKFCHRLQLVDMLLKVAKELGITATYLGEWTGLPSRD